MRGYLPCSVALGYDPLLGRFTSPDSIIPDPGSVIGYNRYVYVVNNPMIYTDPSGNSYECGYLPGTSCANIGPKQKGGTLVKDQNGISLAAQSPDLSHEDIVNGVNKAWGIVEIGLSIFVEPVDWAITGRDCFSGQCSALSLAGLLPGIPSSVGNRLDDVVDISRIADKAADAGRATDVVADSSKALTWNGFRTANKGQYTMEGMSEAWADYKKANGIITPGSFDGIHGNSLNSTRTNFGYQLIQNDTQEILKFGETLSPSTRYTRNQLESMNANMEVITSGSKYDIHMWQHNQIVNYMKLNGGFRPDKNLSDW